MPFPRKFPVVLLALITGGFSATMSAQETQKDASRPAASEKKTQKKALDRSGEPVTGKASYYGEEFFGRTMADGTPMDPDSNIAASRTLPIGTKAEVTNLENGKSAVVEIRDRGPYIDGRIIDLTPKTAEELDMVTEGVVPVEVTPIEVPQRDGSIKLGAAASATRQSGDR
jgi:rare lipoprotein A